MTLTASFGGVDVSHSPREIGFRYGETESSLTEYVYYNDVISSSSGSYSVNLTGLASGRKYYYQAVMQVWNGTLYVPISSSVGSFTTSAGTPVNSLGYLANYEVPYVDISGTLVSGNEASSRGYKWYRYMTTNSNRAVATHTYQYNNKYYRNYTVLMDKEKKSPLWTAFAMNTGMWPDNDYGRYGDWTEDPAFTGLSGTWQNGGVTTGGYDKGHLVASNYRQTSSAQNAQTFYLSNQAPQNSSFNGGLWSQLEQKVVAATPSNSDTLYVVTGVLYEGTAVYEAGIQVPSHFYKCLMKCSFNSSGEMTGATGCAYVFINEEKSNNSPSQLPNYKTTIRSLEGRAGFNFFANVPDEFEEAAETKSTELWTY